MVDPVRPVVARVAGQHLQPPPGQLHAHLRTHAAKGHTCARASALCLSQTPPLGCTHARIAAQDATARPAAAPSPPQGEATPPPGRQRPGERNPRTTGGACQTWTVRRRTSSGGCCCCCCLPPPPLLSGRNVMVARPSSDSVAMISAAVTLSASQRAQHARATRRTAHAHSSAPQAHPLASTTPQLGGGADQLRCSARVPRCSSSLPCRGRGGTRSALPPLPPSHSGPTPPVVGVLPQKVLAVALVAQRVAVVGVEVLEQLCAHAHTHARAPFNAAGMLKLHPHPSEVAAERSCSRAASCPRRAQ